MELPEQPIFDQYPEWIIEPVEPVGWSATQTTGNGHVHVVAAPTIVELRQKLHEVTSRVARA